MKLKNMIFINSLSCLMLIARIESLPLNQDEQPQISVPIEELNPDDTINTGEKKEPEEHIRKKHEALNGYFGPQFYPTSPLSYILSQNLPTNGAAAQRILFRDPFHHQSHSQFRSPFVSAPAEVVQIPQSFFVNPRNHFQNFNPESLHGNFPASPRTQFQNFSPALHGKFPVSLRSQIQNFSPQSLHGNFPVSPRTQFQNFSPESLHGNFPVSSRTQFQNFSPESLHRNFPVSSRTQFQNFSPESLHGNFAVSSKSQSHNVTRESSHGNFPVNHVDPITRAHHFLALNQRPTQVIYQRVPVIIEIIDRTTKNSQSKSNFLTRPNFVHLPIATQSGHRNIGDRVITSPISPQSDNKENFFKVPKEFEQPNNPINLNTFQDIGKLQDEHPSDQTGNKLIESAVTAFQTEINSVADQDSIRTANIATIIHQTQEVQNQDEIPNNFQINDEIIIQNNIKEALDDVIKTEENAEEIISPFKYSINVFSPVKMTNDLNNINNQSMISLDEISSGIEENISITEENITEDFNFHDNLNSETDTITDIFISNHDTNPSVGKSNMNTADSSLANQQPDNLTYSSEINKSVQPNEESVKGQQETNNDINQNSAFNFNGSNFDTEIHISDQKNTVIDLENSTDQDLNQDLDESTVNKSVIHQNLSNPNKQAVEESLNIPINDKSFNNLNEQNTETGMTSLNREPVNEDHANPNKQTTESFIKLTDQNVVAEFNGFPNLSNQTKNENFDILNVSPTVEASSNNLNEHTVDESFSTLSKQDIDHISNTNEGFSNLNEQNIDIIDFSNRNLQSVGKSFNNEINHITDSELNKNNTISTLLTQQESDLNFDNLESNIDSILGEVNQQNDRIRESKSETEILNGMNKWDDLDQLLDTIENDPSLYDTIVNFEEKISDSAVSPISKLDLPEIKKSLQVKHDQKVVNLSLPIVQNKDSIIDTKRVLKAMKESAGKPNLSIVHTTISETPVSLTTSLKTGSQDFTIPLKLFPQESLGDFGLRIRPKEVNVNDERKEITKNSKHQRATKTIVNIRPLNEATNPLLRSKELRSKVFDHLQFHVPTSKIVSQIQNLETKSNEPGTVHLGHIQQSIQSVESLGKTLEKRNLSDMNEQLSSNIEVINVSNFHTKVPTKETISTISIEKSDVGIENETSINGIDTIQVTATQIIQNKGSNMEKSAKVNETDSLVAELFPMTSELENVHPMKEKTLSASLNPIIDEDEILLKIDIPVAEDKIAKKLTSIITPQIKKKNPLELLESIIAPAIDEHLPKILLTNMEDPNISSFPLHLNDSEDNILLVTNMEETDNPKIDIGINMKITPILSSEVEDALPPIIFNTNIEATVETLPNELLPIYTKAETTPEELDSQIRTDEILEINAPSMNDGFIIESFSNDKADNETTSKPRPIKNVETLPEKQDSNIIANKILLGTNAVATDEELTNLSSVHTDAKIEDALTKIKTEISSVPVLSDMIAAEEISIGDDSPIMIAQLAPIMKLDIGNASLLMEAENSTNVTGITDSISNISEFIIDNMNLKKTIMAEIIETPEKIMIETINSNDSDLMAENIETTTVEDITLVAITDLTLSNKLEELVTENPSNIVESMNILNASQEPDKKLPLGLVEPQIISEITETKIIKHLKVENEELNETTDLPIEEVSANEAIFDNSSFGKLDGNAASIDDELTNLSSATTDIKIEDALPKIKTEMSSVLSDTITTEEISLADDSLIMVAQPSPIMILDIENASLLMQAETSTDLIDTTGSISNISESIIDNMNLLKTNNKTLEMDEIVKIPERMIIETIYSNDSNLMTEDIETTTVLSEIEDITLMAITDQTLSNELGELPTETPSNIAESMNVLSASQEPDKTEPLVEPQITEPEFITPLKTENDLPIEISEKEDNFNKATLEKMKAVDMAVFFIHNNLKIDDKSDYFLNNLPNSTSFHQEGLDQNEATTVTSEILLISKKDEMKEDSGTNGDIMKIQENVDDRNIKPNQNNEEDKKNIPLTKSFKGSINAAIPLHSLELSDPLIQKSQINQLNSNLKEIEKNNEKEMITQMDENKKNISTNMHTTKETIKPDENQVVVPNVSEKEFISPDSNTNVETTRVEKTVVTARKSFSVSEPKVERRQRNFLKIIETQPMEIVNIEENAPKKENNNANSNRFIDKVIVDFDAQKAEIKPKKSINIVDRLLREFITTRREPTLGEKNRLQFPIKITIQNPNLLASLRKMSQNVTI